jgi:hypothetical protein
MSLYFAKDDDQSVEEFIVFAEMINITPVSKPTCDSMRIRIAYPYTEPFVLIGGCKW